MKTESDNNPVNANPSAADYAAAVQKNSAYYLKQFDKFSADSRNSYQFTWNWAAFLFPFIWPAYRRMRGVAILAPLLFVTGVWWLDPTNVFAALYLFSPGVILGMIGNYLYYAKLRSDIRYKVVQTNTKETSKISAAIALLYTSLVLFIGLNGPVYFSNADRMYDGAALSDLRNAKITMEAISVEHESYASATLRSSSGVATLADNADKPATNDVQLSRGVVMNLLVVDKECYLISAKHEKGPHLYLAEQNMNDALRARLRIEGNAAISEIARADVERMQENDRKAYTVLQNVRGMASKLAVLDRNEKINKDTFGNLTREQGVKIDLPCSNGTASRYLLFARHDNGSKLFFSCACSDKVFGIQVPIDGGDTQIDEWYSM